MQNLMDVNQVARRLRSLRENKKMSAAAVAKEIGISESALLMYETGNRVPRDNIKIMLANYYEQPIGSLFYGQ